MSQPGSGRGPLALGGVAALLASVCCLGPLLLVMIGVSGAWVGNLTALEPYRPVFIGAALLALFFAYRRIFRPAVCEPDVACAVPSARRTYQLLFWIVAALTLLAITFPYIVPLFY